MSTELPQTINYKRRRFNTFADVLIITSETTGAVVDISTSSFVMYVTTTKTPDSHEVADIVYSVTGTVIDGPAGEVEFVPTLEQATQSDGTLYHEVVMTDSTGRTRTVAIGKYTYF